MVFLRYGSGFRVQGAGCRVQGAGCRVQGAGFRVSGGCAGERRAHVCLAPQCQRRHHGIASGFHVELSCLVGLAGLDTEHTIPRCWPFSALGTQKLRAVQNCGNWRRHVMSTERCTFGCAAGGRRAHVCLAPQHQHRHHGIVSAIPSSSLLVSMKVQAGPQHEGPSRPSARLDEGPSRPSARSMVTHPVHSPAIRDDL